MKTNKFLAALALATVAFAPLTGFSADKTTKENAKKTTANSASIRVDLEKAFIELTANSLDALKTAWQENEENDGLVSKGLGDAKFKITEVETPTETTTTTTTTEADGTTTTNTTTNVEVTESKLAVKIWFELADGTLVNPMKRRWNAREKFYVHIQAAVPVYVSLFQNYPDSNPASRKIYPDKRYKDSFKVVQAGQSTRLPVAFEMDDDKTDEIMSMVVVRSDWSGIQNGLTRPATSSVEADNGSLAVVAQATEAGAGTLKCINERVVTKSACTAKEVKSAFAENISDKAAERLAKEINKASDNAKFNIVPSKAETSDQPNEICFYMFSDAEVGQWQLTIKK